MSLDRTPFGVRLVAARRHAKLTQKQLAERVGMGQSSLAEAERTGQGSAKAALIASVCGVRPLWLTHGEGEMVDPAESALPVDLDAHPELTRIRTVTIKVSGGVTGYAVEPDDETGLPIFFRADWMAQRGYKPYELLAVKVKGSSMEPNLYPGDMVVINTADTEPKDGEVFAVNYEGEPVIKRLVRDSGSWWLVSDSPDQSRYPRKQWLDSSSFVIGRVVHRQSERI